MKNFNKSVFSTISVFTLGFFLTGCISGPIDHQRFAGVDDIEMTVETEKNIRSKENAEAIKLAVLPSNASLTNAYVRKYEMNKVVGDKIEALCSELSVFRLIARSEIDIIAAENAVKNLNNPNAKITLPESVDNLLTYSITACNIDARDFNKREYVGYGNSRRVITRKIRKHNGYIALKLTLIDPQTHNQQSYTVSGRSKWDEGETSQLLIDAVDNALKDFIQRFAYDYARPGVVMQTVGKGRWAKISLGRNDGLRYRSKVEFFTKDKKGNQYPFARGEVRELNNKYAWVYVSDYDTVAVRVNSLVKVSAKQKNSFVEWIRSPFLYGTDSLTEELGKML